MINRRTPCGTSYPDAHKHAGAVAVSVSPQAKTWYCLDCGGTDVEFKAWTRWDPDIQDFVITSEDDDNYCNICEQNDVRAEFGVPGQQEDS